MKAISKPTAPTATFAVITIVLSAQLAYAQPPTSRSVSVPIELDDVPLDAAIQALAREADINYLIDPRVTRWWERSLTDGGTDQTPIENFRETNITPQEALERILQEHHLVLLEDPQTGIAQVTYPKQTIPSLDPSLYDVMTNQIRQVLPNIQLTDVPLDVCLQALAREAGINYFLDPRIGWGTPDENGQIRQSPLLTVRWQNVTPAQALLALCENYGLVIYEAGPTRIFFISPRNEQITNFVDASLLGSDTNRFVPIQMAGNAVWQGPGCSNTNVIEIDNEPLETALKELADCAQIKVVLDTDLPDVPPISFCGPHFSPKTAIVVLCDLYGLAITKDPATGVIEIGPDISHSSGVPLVPSGGNG